MYVSVNYMSCVKTLWTRVILNIAYKTKSNIWTIFIYLFTDLIASSKYYLHGKKQFQLLLAGPDCPMCRMVHTLPR